LAPPRAPPPRIRAPPAAQEGSRLEFVLTNGEGKFDTPNPYGEAALPPNYVIPEPGTWRLKSGRLERVQG
jgi:hypothetical protein